MFVEVAAIYIIREPRTESNLASRESRRSMSRNRLRACAATQYFEGRQLSARRGSAVRLGSAPRLARIIFLAMMVGFTSAQEMSEELSMPYEKRQLFIFHGHSPSPPPPSPSPPPPPSPSPPPPSPPPPSPSPPPPYPLGHIHSPHSHSPHSHYPVAQNTYFTITSGPCTVDPSSPNCIRSPNFPSNYGNNETCVITPTALAIGMPLTATSFDVSFFFDDDELRIPSHPDGTLRAFFFLGPRNFILGPGTIQWSSDISFNDTGWRVCSETREDLTGVIVGVLVGGGVCLCLCLCLCLYCCLSRRRKEARGPPPLQRPTTVAHEPQPAVATKTNLTTQANLNLMSAATSRHWTAEVSFALAAIAHAVHALAGARGPPPLQRPTTEAHEPQPAVATKTNLTTQANLNLMSA